MIAMRWRGSERLICGDGVASENWRGLLKGDNAGVDVLSVCNSCGACGPVCVSGIRMVDNYAFCVPMMLTRCGGSCLAHALWWDHRYLV